MNGLICLRNNRSYFLHVKSPTFNYENRKYVFKAGSGGYADGTLESSLTKKTAVLLTQ